MKGIEMICENSNSAAKKYRKGIFLTMSGYVLILFGVASYFRLHPHSHSVSAYFAAALPALPVLCMLGVVGIYLRDEKDEFMRWMMIQSMLWATGVVLATATVVGFIENFTGFKAPPAFYIFVLFWFVFGLAQAILKRQGRPSDD